MIDLSESYAIYINGKLLAESTTDVPNRAGGQPRGAHVYADFFNEFKDGKVTIAATGFLRHGPTTGGCMTVWIEEQKLPPLGQ